MLVVSSPKVRLILPLACHFSPPCAENHFYFPSNRRVFFPQNPFPNQRSLFPLVDSTNMGRQLTSPKRANNHPRAVESPSQKYSPCHAYRVPFLERSPSICMHVAASSDVNLNLSNPKNVHCIF